MVGFDTAIFISLVEGHPRFGTTAAEVLERVARGHNLAVTAVIKVTEFVVKPLQRGQPGLADIYQAAVTSFPDLAVVPNTEDVARAAAEFRAAYGFRLPDTLHLAACLQAGATLFLTNDRRLRRVRELVVVTLDECEQPELS